MADMRLIRAFRQRGGSFNQNSLSFEFPSLRKPSEPVKAARTPPPRKPQR
jgi:hypothetical protein